MMIKTTHVGSLPRSAALLAANNRRADCAILDEEFDDIVQREVADVVARQKAIGIDIVNDGEYGHIMRETVDYGAWWFYSFTRLSGISFRDSSAWDATSPKLSRPGHIQLTSFDDRRDRKPFAQAYADPTSGIHTAAKTPRRAPVFTEEIRYIGHDAARRDIAALQQAMAENQVSEGFIAALSPGSAARLRDEFYGDESALLTACADAMAEEYKIITDAGLTVQIDAPDLAESWDQINPEPTVDDYCAWLQGRIDAINHALRGIDPQRVRLHICWGSWHGPHTTDIPFEVIVDQCLQVNAGSFSFEAASGRHAHEWRVWQGDRLPSERKIVPGVISHSTNIVEHPQLVADRLIRFAELVGPDRVIASTDCGLGGRIHEQIAWAKLESLAAGARIANEYFA
ncbi:cobalamin-independent methionine synthase II family protein [Trueperella sp. LYQ143]|uniref:cobalamin-independent methionine synthase II family protein n=1 Tax=Trueperella sp. LYQ143 TaxID=3391059 RepID=UPI00398308F5